MEKHVNSNPINAKLYEITVAHLDIGSKIYSITLTCLHMLLKCMANICKSESSVSLRGKKTQMAHAKVEPVIECEPVCTHTERESDNKEPTIKYHSSRFQPIFLLLQFFEFVQPSYNIRILLAKQSKIRTISTHLHCNVTM